MFVVINKNLDELEINLCNALRDLVPFVQFKKRENTHGGVLLFVKLHVSAFEMITILTRNYKLSLKTVDSICGKGV